MKTFQEFLEKIHSATCLVETKYSKVGKAFYKENEDFKGIYWYYETKDFIIDIHDFFIKREKVFYSYPEINKFISFSSSYIITASGECFNPYQTLSSNTMYIENTTKSKDNFRVLLHGNFPYLSVGINYKEKMLNEYLSSIDNRESFSISDMFFDSRLYITEPLGKIANSILNCNMTSSAAKIFFEAKAKEWLSITLDAYLNKEKIKKISIDDSEAIKNVASYIDDHYALDISQEILEKIALMSGTKLKKIFKQKYQMSITEYTQRKRMNIAEILLLTTTLEIKDVAKSVGYSSHSKFTTYFKKYKGLYPYEVKNISKKSLLEK